MQETPPTPPLVLAEMLLGAPASFGFGLAIADGTVRAATTVIDLELVAIWGSEDESVAVTVILKVPLVL